MTVSDYLASLPEDRRAALTRIRDTVNANLPAGYEEGIQYGMISWYVPLSRYPDTYNQQALMLAGVASQKNHMALYLMTAYGDSTLNAWFKKSFADAGKKLDMGKACVRFKTLDALPLEVIGELIGKVQLDDYVAIAETARAGTAERREVLAKEAEARIEPESKPKATAKAKPKAKAKAKPKAQAKAKRKVKPKTKAKPAKVTKTKAKSKSKRR